EGAGIDEPRRTFVRHEQRGDHDVQFVDETGGEEQGVDSAAALDHQSPHAAGGQIFQHLRHVQRVAGVDHVGQYTKPNHHRRDGRTERVNNLRALAQLKKVNPRIKIAAAGDGNLNQIQ